MPRPNRNKALSIYSMVKWRAQYFCRVISLGKRKQGSGSGGETSFNVSTCSQEPLLSLSVWLVKTDRCRKTVSNLAKFFVHCVIIFVIFL